MMLSLIAVAGAAIDVGSWYQAKRSLQNAADAAALAGASQIPNSWSAATSTAAAEYTKNGKPGDTTNYANTSNAAAGDSITVTATRQAPTYFTRVFGFMGVTITATARATVSSFTTVRSNQDIMPWGVMKGTYTTGQSYEIYTDNSSSNNGALSLPYVNNANCPVPNGANPYRDEIDGTLNSCPVSVGEQLDVKPGQNAGPTRQGIDTRITTWKPLDQIVQMNPNGQATVIDPTSKQLVLIPDRRRPQRRHKLAQRIRLGARGRIRLVRDHRPTRLHQQRQDRHRRLRRPRRRHHHRRRHRRLRPQPATPTTPPASPHNTAITAITA